MGIFDKFKILKKEKVETEQNQQNNNTNNNTKLTETENEELIKTLPKFKYHPNVYSNSITTFGNGICQCCNKEVKAYVETMYTIEDINCICFNCIADGSAAQKFDGSFIQHAQDIKNKDAIEELNSRTPGYVSWQGEYWLACCDDYCEFIGDVGTKELNEMGIADEVFEEYEKSSPFDDNDWIKENLTAGGSVAGYLFKCRHCGKYHLHIDMS